MRADTNANGGEGSARRERKKKRSGKKLLLGPQRARSTNVFVRRALAADGARTLRRGVPVRVGEQRPCPEAAERALQPPAEESAGVGATC